MKRSDHDDEQYPHEHCDEHLHGLCVEYEPRGAFTAEDWRYWFLTPSRVDWPTTPALIAASRTSLVPRG